MNINYSFLFKKLSFYIIISGLSLLVLSCNSFSDANDLESNSEKVMNNDLKENIIIKNIEIIPNDYCIAWSAIEEWTNENDGNNLRTKEGWNKRIKLTQNLIVSVPVQYQAIGFLYLEIVRDRAELLSEFNYVLLTEIPSNIKQSFIQEHFDDQQEANKLIDFVRSDCEYLNNTISPTTISPTTISPTTISPTTISPTTISPTTISPSKVMKNMLKVPEYAENSIAGSLIDVWQCTAGHEILVQDLETDYIDDIKCSVTIVFNSNKLIVKTTGIPNHDLESGIGCCASEQSREWSLPLNPIAVEKDNYTMAPDRGPVAVAVNGAAIYGPEEGPGGDAVALEYGKFEEDRQPIELGICGGHSGPGGEYHYHYDANCIHWHPDTSSGEDSKDYNIDKLDKSEHSPVIGFAFDGYPIYGFFGFDNNGYVREMTSSYQLNAGANGYNGSDDYIYLEGLGDLDRCNGHFGVTPDFPNGEYHYHSTIKSGSGDMGFPYFIHCYHGVPDESNFSAGQGMEPGGRPPGGRPPGGRPPPRR
jgi:hypothetical protein